MIGAINVDFAPACRQKKLTKRNGWRAALRERKECVVNANRDRVLVIGMERMIDKN